MSKPIVSLILAMSENRTIGDNNALPWHLPDDLKFFKAHTTGKTVIMGRKTFDSIGKPLPKRTNIVLSRHEKREIPGTIWVASIDEALEYAKHDDEVMIMGGANLYKQALPYMDRLYLTRVDAVIDGDTQMPEIDLTGATLTFEEHHAKDERHAHEFTFQIWDFNRV